MKSRVAELLEIQYPIIQGGMDVGTLWVMTYMAATEAQYYEYLTSGRTSPEF